MPFFTENLELTKLSPVLEGFCESSKMAEFGKHKQVYNINGGIIIDCPITWFKKVLGH
jgi:hypothetical protein